MFKSINKAVTGMYFKAMNKISNFMKEENGDVNIVSIVVLIGIAVLLAIVFKDAIGELIETLLDSIKTKATSAALDEI